MDKIKSIRIKQVDGEYSEAIPLAVDGTNVDLSNGTSLEQNLNNIEDKIKDTNDSLKEYLPLTGGTLSGNLNVIPNGNGRLQVGKVLLVTNSEGGNIQLKSPDEYDTAWEADALRGNLRIFGNKDGAYYFPLTLGMNASDCTFSGNAATATTLSSTLAANKGGTGQTSLKAAANAFINALDIASAVPQDEDYIITQYAGGGTSNTDYYRKPMSRTWDYIKGKASTVFLPLTGGTLSGGLKVNGDLYGGDKICMWTDGEGGNLRIRPPEGNAAGSNYWEIDAFNGHLRFYRNMPDGTNSSALTLTTTVANSSFAGNAATATKLSSAKTIALTGAVTGSASFDGSAGISIATTQTGYGSGSTYKVTGVCWLPGVLTSSNVDIWFTVFLDKQITATKATISGNFAARMGVYLNPNGVNRDSIASYVKETVVGTNYVSFRLRQANDAAWSKTSTDNNFPVSIELYQCTITFS